MKRIIQLLTMTFLIGSCGTMMKHNISHFNLKDFGQLKVGLDTEKTVKNKLGTPDEKSTRGNSKYWAYNLRKVPKLELFFDKGVLTMVVWGIWDSDPETSIAYFLSNVKGNWRVIKEPVTNPHALPFMCYLEDLNLGKRVYIHGHKKIVEELSKWKPSKEDISIETHLLKKVGKEYCIGGFCSKVTNPNLWGHDHCKWLEDEVIKHK